MNDTHNLGFLSALGEEFCEVLTPVVGIDGIVPHDAYELFIRAIDKDPSPGLLAAISDSQLELLRRECERYFRT